MANNMQATAVSQFPLPERSLYAQIPPNVTDPGYPQPPPPLKEGDTYAMFGSVYTVDDKLPSLEDSGRKTLYDETKLKSGELKRLNKLLLATFVELVHSLSHEADPQAYKRPAEEIENILVNMHHLINTLRPEQARQNIKGLIDLQTEQRERALALLNKAEDRAFEHIALARQSLTERLPAAPKEDTERVDAPASQASGMPNGDSRTNVDESGSAAASRLSHARRDDELIQREVQRVLDQAATQTDVKMEP